MCRVLQVHPSGFYSWLKNPNSKRTKEDRRLSGLIKASWLESGSIYGYRRIHQDLKCLGEVCGHNRVAKIMRKAGLSSQRGYKKRPYFKGVKRFVVSNNILNRRFQVKKPNHSWVTDITYIKTHEGWLYLAVVIDLFSRQIIGWSMKNRLHTDIVLNALLMAIWRRKPENTVLIHSDQGVQYTSTQWQLFLKTNNLVSSMSRRGNCHDNAVAESFFANLKTERLKRKIFKSREDARAEIFDYIELFYNPKRQHSANNGLSPVEYERRYFMKLSSV